MVHIIDGPHQAFASRLLDLRREKKLTQEELAQAINVDKRSISTYENGRTFPREDTINRLAQKLEVDPNWLATGIDKEMNKFIAEQNSKYDAANLIKKVDLLYIEKWVKLGGRSNLANRVTYNASPEYKSHCSDLSKFVPIIKTSFQNYRAVEYPGALPLNLTYPAGTIIIFDSGTNMIEDIPSGSDIIYRLRSEENDPGLRTVLKEPGVQPVLIPIDTSYCIQPISATNMNIEIIGIVKSVMIGR
ncbi:helix-turn-helix domain-containing protein [Psychrobacter sp. T6-6]|uniref:helix-turn-helix domain-containing protein n=1 Tax=Psychrobacter sp. T6-6 TaxID=3457452 RepID=UPI003FD4A9F2